MVLNSFRTGQSLDPTEGQFGLEETLNTLTEVGFGLMGHIKTNTEISTFLTDGFDMLTVQWRRDQNVPLFRSSLNFRRGHVR